MTEGNPSFRQQVFDITQAPAESEVQSNSVFDDFWRKAMVVEARVFSVVCHAGCLEMRGGTVNLTIPATTLRSWRMHETYVKVRWKWVYFYRVVNKAGKPLDFALSERRNEKAATLWISLPKQQISF